LFNSARVAAGSSNFATLSDGILARSAARPRIVIVDPHRIARTAGRLAVPATSE
jgi:hypothetical protein